MRRQDQRPEFFGGCTTSLNTRRAFSASSVGGPPRPGRFCQAGQPQIHKPLPPQPHRHGAGRQLRGNRFIALALRRQEGNPGAAHQLLRGGGSVDQSLQLAALFRG